MDDHGNGEATATRIKLGVAQAGVIETAGDVDAFTIDLVAGRYYRFSTPTIDAGMDPYLSVHRGSALLGANDNAAGLGLGSQLVLQASSSVRHRVEVRHAQGGRGSYTVRVDEVVDDHGDDAAHATPVDLGRTTPGVLPFGADQDWISIPLLGGQTYTLVFAVGTPTYVTVSVVNESGVALLTPMAANNALALTRTLKPTQDGRYFLRAAMTASYGVATTFQAAFHAGSGSPCPPDPRPAQGMISNSGEEIVLRGSVFDPNGESVSWRWFLAGRLLGQGTVTTAVLAEVPLPQVRTTGLAVGTHTFTLEVEDGSFAAVSEDVQVTVSDQGITGPELDLKEISPRLAPLVGIVSPVGGARFADSVTLDVAYAAYTVNEVNEQGSFTFLGQQVAGKNVGDVGDLAVYVDKRLMLIQRAPSGSQGGQVRLGPIDLRGVPSGRHALTVVGYRGDANDDIGRLSNSVWIWVDHDAPVVTIVTPAAGSTSGTRRVRISGTASDPAGVREVRIDGDLATDASGQGTFATWYLDRDYPGKKTATSYTATASSVDRLGNAGTSASVTFTVAPTAEDVECFGTPLSSPSGSVIYVLDISGSMDWDSRPYTTLDGRRANGTRLERAKTEVMRSIAALPADFVFSIVAFESYWYWWSATTVSATTANKDRALGWIRSLQAMGATATGPAVADVLKKRRENLTLVLVTDGYPNVGANSMEAHRQMIRAANTQGAMIHTFGIATGGGSNRTFLTNIAADSGGTYVEVP